MCDLHTVNLTSLGGDVGALGSGEITGPGAPAPHLPLGGVPVNKQEYHPFLSRNTT